jgi:lipopolysaccharide biosynthesis glycosyltransferase
VSFDDKYLYPFLLLAFSIYKNTTYTPKIFIANVNATLSQGSQRILKEFAVALNLNVEIIPVKVPEHVQTDDRISIASYGRLCLADYLVEDFVYIDTDSLVMPGWELIYDYMTLLEEKSEYLLAAMPALGNQSAPWPVSEDDKTQYRFHASLLVIKSRNWKEHFLKEENPSWQKIATLHEDLKFVSHDQTVLQYAAQGRFLHLPPDFVSFATKMNVSTRIITSGLWRKSWTIPRDDLLRYFNWLLLSEDYLHILSTIKEFDIFLRYEDEMLIYFEEFPKLLLTLQEVRKVSESRIDFFMSLPFVADKFMFGILKNVRWFLNQLRRI